MTIVFDENVPWPLRKILSDHVVTSVQREGLGGAENGELLTVLDGKFEFQGGLMRHKASTLQI